MKINLHNGIICSPNHQKRDECIEANNNGSGQDLGLSKKYREEK